MKNTKLDYFDNCKTTHGSVIYKGVEYALMEDAQIDNIGTNGQVAFFSTGFSRKQLATTSTPDVIDCSFDEHIEVQWDCDEWTSIGTSLVMALCK